MIIGITVDFIPTDKPLIIFVAEPVCELSAISLTLLYFSEVYISVTLPIASTNDQDLLIIAKKCIEISEEIHCLK